MHQQGVVEVKRLIRQRARWFQGNLQSWRLIPLVLAQHPRRARTDLLFLLSSPALVLISSLLTVSFGVVLANCALLLATGHDPFGWWVAATYALILGPALTYAGVYWKQERRRGPAPGEGTPACPPVRGLQHDLVRGRLVSGRPRPAGPQRLGQD